MMTAITRASLATRG